MVGLHAGERRRERDGLRAEQERRGDAGAASATSPAPSATATRRRVTGAPPRGVQRRWSCLERRRELGAGAQHPVVGEAHHPAGLHRRDGGEPRDGVGRLVHRRVHHQVGVVGHGPLQRVDRPGALPRHHVHPAGDAEQRVRVAARTGHHERVAPDDEQHPAARERRGPLLGGPHGRVHLAPPAAPRRPGCRAPRRRGGPRAARRGRPPPGGPAPAPPARRCAGPPGGPAVGEPEDEVGAQPQHRLRAGVEEAAHPRQRLHLGCGVVAGHADQPVGLAQRDHRVGEAGGERDHAGRARRGRGPEPERARRAGAGRTPSRRERRRAPRRGPGRGQRREDVRSARVIFRRSRRPRSWSRCRRRAQTSPRAVTALATGSNRSTLPENRSAAKPTPLQKARAPGAARVAGTAAPTTGARARDVHRDEGRAGDVGRAGRGVGEEAAGHPEPCRPGRRCRPGSGRRPPGRPGSRRVRARRWRCR